ncbi:MAG TPA: DUF2161 family putative PD-(D/E)XK-type phosphodiesterase [Azospirillaceae bacterium]|nr:DUF2161 family putative PD-(D/E)XK-type phosphodiesterase [Azospirillaceae bacterium]
MPSLSRESDLYAPVRAFLANAGYEVRGEVADCDVVAVRDDTVLAVELKRTFGLPVLYQALGRLSAVDLAYVAVPAPDGRTARRNWDAQLPDAVRLCRMLGLGLLSVRDGRVLVHADPAPYRPRKQPKKRARLLGEFTRRSGDHNVGGSSKRTIVTAYREDALRCADALAARGEQPARPAEIRKTTGVDKAATILRRNVYGWFERTGRGLYALTPAGRQALVDYAAVVAGQKAKAPAA